MLPKIFCALVLASLLFPRVRAQAPSGLSPASTTALLKELKAIQDKQAKMRRDRFSGLAAQLTSASGSNDSAARYFADAVRQVDFSGGSGDGKRFQEWREKNKDLLSKDKAFGTAARLHLRYLVITLNHTSDPNGAPPLRDLWEYLSILASAQKEFGDGLAGNDESKRLLLKPLTESPIVRANRLEPELEKLKDWEMVAGSFDDILDKDIRAPLREKQDPRLIDTWKMQIDVQTAAQGASRNDTTRANFEQVDLPRLHWGKAQDEILIGQRNPGIADMVKIVRTFQNHPDLPAWVAELTKVLKTPVTSAFGDSDPTMTEVPTSDATPESTPESTLPSGVP